MIKQVNFAKESRDKILSGVQQISKAVRVTMGAAGKNVLIGEAVYGNDGLFHIPTKVSKDGYTVAKHFELPDSVENRGAMMIREAATKTVEEAGDATTCTCVLAESLITNGMKLIDEGANSQEIKKGMDMAAEYVVTELKKMSIEVKGDKERVRQIATVSANNDSIIGDFIAEAYAQIGNEGVITAEEGKGTKTEIKITDGYKFDRGWVSPYFITNRAKEICEFIDPLILLYKGKINHHTQIEKAIEISVQQNRPLLVISDDCVDEGLAYLAVNNARKAFKVCAVKSPFGENKDEEMQDIALLTGGDYISDITGIDIKEVAYENLGKAEKVIISKGETIIVSGSKTEDKFDELVADLRMNLTQAKTEGEKYPIEKRISRLTGKGAVIVVGAATETELNEKLDRVDDAIRSTKSAISFGFLPGGGTAFLRIKNTIQAETNKDRNAGISLVFAALSAPLKQICENAGVDKEMIYAKVMEEKGSVGYNALTDAIEDMVKTGVIDSTKALSCAVTNSVSVAGMVLTSECSIVTVS